MKEPKPKKVATTEQKLKIRDKGLVDEIARLFLLGHECNDIATICKLSIPDVTLILSELEKCGLLQVDNAVARMDKSYDLQYSRVKNWTLQTLSIGLKLFFERIHESRHSIEIVKDLMRKVAAAKGQLYLEPTELGKKILEKKIYGLESEIRIAEYRISELSVDDVTKLIDAVKILEERKIDDQGYNKGTIVMAGMSLKEAKEIIRTDPVIAESAQKVSIDNEDFLSGIEEFISPEEE